MSLLADFGPKPNMVKFSMVYCSQITAKLLVMIPPKAILSSYC